jgi:hypothetical protein
MSLQQLPIDDLVFGTVHGISPRFLGEEVNKRFENNILIGNPVLSAPEHHIAHMTAVALQKHIAGAERNKDACLVKR